MIGTENPAAERSGSTSEESRGNPLPKPAKSQNTSKNEGDEEVQSDLLHDLRDWLQEFRENLVDERSLLEPQGDPSLGHRDTSCSSHELPMESRAKVEPGSGKHGVHTHFPKDPYCNICLKTKITRASCKKTRWYSRTQSGKFGDLIPADHRILSADIPDMPEFSVQSLFHLTSITVLTAVWAQACRLQSKTTLSLSGIFGPFASATISVSVYSRPRHFLFVRW